MVDRLGHRVCRLGGQREELRRGHGGGGGVGGGAEVAALLEEGVDGLDVGALARGVHRVVQVHPLQVRHRRRYLNDISGKATCRDLSTAIKRPNIVCKSD